MNLNKLANEQKKMRKRQKVANMKDKLLLYDVNPEEDIDYITVREASLKYWERQKNKKKKVNKNLQK